MMKKTGLIMALVVVFTVSAQEKKSFLTQQHINWGFNFSNYSNFKLNNYFSEYQITPVKNLTFGSLITVNFLFKNNIGIYTSIGAGSSLNNKNNQSNKLNVFRLQLGPSYQFINKTKLKMTISPLYSYESMHSRLYFNSNVNLSTFFQNKTGNAIELNRISSYLGLNLSTYMFDFLTLNLEYSYNINQSAFKMIGNSNSSTSLPLEQNGVFTVSFLTKIK